MNRLLIFHPRNDFEIAKSLHMKKFFKLLAKLEGVGGQRQTHRGLTNVHPLNSMSILALLWRWKTEFQVLVQLDSDCLASMLNLANTCLLATLINCYL